MSCIYTEHDSAPVAEIRVISRVTQNDMSKIIPQLEAFIKKHGKVRLVEIIEDFEGFDPSTILEGIRFDIQHMKDISHVAVVSDKGWIGMMTAVAGRVLPVTLRVFSMAEVEAARAWALEPDGEQEPEDPTDNLPV